MGRDLRFRFGQQDEMRSQETVDAGVPDAPVGHAAIVFMYPVGISSLLAWNAQVTRTVSRLLPQLESIATSCGL